MKLFWNVRLSKSFHRNGYIKFDFDIYISIYLFMQKNYSQLFIGIIIGLIVGLLVAKTLFVNNNNTLKPTVKQQKDIVIQDNTNKIQNGNIPAKAITVLNYIKANNSAMDGYVGGRVFTNREKILPQEDTQGNAINYQEWDVNQKVQGQNRGTERICTGSDGRSWYTNDHYRSFTEIK
jgi:guanyl-specific ribonuclease Sa